MLNTKTPLQKIGEILYALNNTPEAIKERINKNIMKPKPLAALGGGLNAWLPQTKINERLDAAKKMLQKTERRMQKMVENFSFEELKNDAEFKMLCLEQERYLSEIDECEE